MVLVDDTGRMLLQQRAAVKTRFALRWANACCGHPRPTEPVTVAAERRLSEELGIPVIPLTEIGVHVYQAADPASGRIEYEYDHVLFGRLDPATPVHPDPDEVATVTWVSPARPGDRAERARRPVRTLAGRRRRHVLAARLGPARVLRSAMVALIDIGDVA